MIQKLPVGRFRWANVEPGDVSRLASSKKGYLLEADIDYPGDLHDLHNELPFMCEKLRVNRVKKLVPNLHDKKNYVIPIKALKQALEHGLMLKKIHRTIEFDQSV